MDDLEAAPEQGGDVLHEDELGSKNANGVGDPVPEAGVLPGDPGPLAGVADVLVIPNSG